MNNSLFTLDGYARLIFILRDHPECRDAVINSGKEMSAASLESKLRRDYFWSTVIEKVLNDYTYHPRTPELLGIVDIVNVENLPPCHRFGDRLKEWFRKLRSAFTRPYDNWKRSGQNDPDRFIAFLSKFQGKLTAKSMRLNVFSPFADAEC